MNFKKIFDLQKELDTKFENNRNERGDLRSSKEIRPSKILALIVEMAEFANEVQSFKYWKVNKTIDRSKMLEEYADVIHFLSSLAVEFDLDPNIEIKIYDQDNINNQFMKIFAEISSLNDDNFKEKLQEIFSLSLGFTSFLEIDFDQLSQAYLDKANINLNRIKNKY